MLALGTCVGGSFFLSTAVPLRAAGPSAIAAFAIGGIVVYIILMALSELTVAHPAHGSFREYAEHAFGPMASFVVGWLYWAGLVLALSSEAVAVAVFARLWVPGVPIWLLSLVVILGVTGLNLLDVRLFSRIESVMAAVKLMAIVAFVLLMAAVLVGLIPGRPFTGLGAIRTEPLLPTGISGFAGSMLLILFAYAGFEVLGLAAPDAKDPGRSIPRAVVLTVFSLVVLYMTAMAVILAVVPLGRFSSDVSPFLEALQLGGFPALASGLNLVIVSASLSTMMAAMYGLGRMLYSLSEEGQAPKVFGRLSPTGAPRLALVASAASMLVGVVLAFVLPKQVYLFLVSSGGFSLLFAYLTILASQLVIRRREGCQGQTCQLPWYPYSTWAGIVAILGAMAAMPLVPGQGAGLVVGLALLVALSGIYALRRRTPTPDPEPVTDAKDRLLIR